jgi:hypothetical protein
MLFQCIHGRGGGFIRPLRASPATAHKTKTRTMILGRPENNRGPTKKQHSPITGPETHVVIALPPPSPLPPRQRHASACRAAPPPPPPGNGRVYFGGRLAPGFGNSPRWGEEENFAFQPGRTAIAPGRSTAASQHLRRTLRCTASPDDGTSSPADRASSRRRPSSARFAFSWLPTSLALQCHRHQQRPSATPASPIQLHRGISCFFAIATVVRLAICSTIASQWPDIFCGINLDTD